MCIRDRLVTVRSGDYKGQQMQVYNYVGPLYGGPLKVGDRATILILSLIHICPGRTGSRP